jgi:hypothetical protein
VCQQHDPSRSKPHLPRVSFEQLKAKLALERLDALSEGRLREVKAGGRMSEMAKGGDFYEGPELPQFHVLDGLLRQTSRHT